MLFSLKLICLFLF
jgi:hypothetical protein